MAQSSADARGGFEYQRVRAALNAPARGGEPAHPAPTTRTVVHVMHRAANGPGGERIDFFLTARRWSGQPVVREPDKCDELSWHPLEELPPNTIPYIAAALAAYRAGSFFSEWGWEPTRHWSGSEATPVSAHVRATGPASDAVAPAVDSARPR